MSSRFNAAIGAIRKTHLNGIYDPHTNAMQYPKSMQPTHARWEQIDDYAEVEPKTPANEDDEDNQTTPSMFTPVKPIYSRNFMIIDTVYESAPASNVGVPGPDGDVHDLGFNGLSSIPDDIKSELPPECLEAFEKALQKELEWKNRWNTESAETLRREPIIDKGVV